MPVNSRQKGKRGELAFVKVLKGMGYNARRGQQFKGGADSPDIVCPDLPGIHFEVKFGDVVVFGNAAMDKALEQAATEAITTSKMPTSTGTIAGYKSPRPVVAFHNTHGRKWWLAWVSEGLNQPIYTEATRAALVQLNGEQV
jgi:hypothetical protein